MEKNKAKGKSPVVQKPHRQLEKPDGKCKVSIPSVVECENVTIDVVLCQGSLLYPKWEIEKTGTGNCFNANGTEHPSATFEVVIKKPDSKVQLCWFVKYEVTKPDGVAITSRNCQEGVDTAVLVQLKRRFVSELDLEPEVVHTYEAPLDAFNNNIATGQLAVCTELDSENCDVESEYFVTARYCYSCNGESYAQESDCECSLLIVPADGCQNNSEYVFSDSLDVAGTLTITHINPTPTPACTDLFVIHNNPDFVLNNEKVLITPDCLDDNGQVTLTILATLPQMPKECAQHEITIKNTATISLVVGSRKGPCTKGTEITTVSDQVLCISNKSCDNPHQTATVTISCVKPQVCVTTDRNCNPKFCLCKLSKTVYAPVYAPELFATIEYDITVTRSLTTCTFTPKFAFTACPGRPYSYEIKKLNGEVIQGPVGNISPCPLDTSIVPSPDCNICETTPNCLVTAAPIDVNSLNDDTEVQLFIYNNNGDLIIPAVTICVPIVATEVFLSDCIRVAGCDFIPTPDTIVVTEPADDPDTDNSATRQQILDFLLSIISCTRRMPLTPDELNLLLTYGFHFYIILSDACCGDVTLINEALLIINRNQPNSQTARNEVTNTIHFPPCDA